MPLGLTGAVGGEGSRGSVTLRMLNTGNIRHQRRHAELHLHLKAEDEVKLRSRRATSDLVSTRVDTGAERVNGRRSSVL